MQGGRTKEMVTPRLLSFQRIKGASIKVNSQRYGMLRPYAHLVEKHMNWTFTLSSLLSKILGTMTFLIAIRFLCNQSYHYSVPINDHPPQSLIRFFAKDPNDLTFIHGLLQPGFYFEKALTLDHHPRWHHLLGWIVILCHGSGLLHSS